MTIEIATKVVKMYSELATITEGQKNGYSGRLSEDGGPIRFL